MVWDLLGKVIPSNARFGLNDRLEVYLDHVRMPTGNGKGAAKTMERSLNVLSAIKKSTVVLKAAFLCLAHALIIAMARVNGDPKYKLYRNGYLLDQLVDEPLKVSGVDLYNGGSLEELHQFQDYLSDYKIIVYDGLSPDRLIFSGNSVSNKKLYLLYDADTGNYNVITNIKQLWQKIIYVTSVTPFMTIHISVKKVAPCVLLHLPVLKSRLGIVAHATGHFSLRSVFRII